MEQYNEIIESKSEKYNIPADLIRAIIQVESSGDTYAMRYEDHWSYFEKPFDKWHWHKGTEREAQKFSYGLMQIMGSVARQHGFDGRFLSELCDAEINLEYGCKHLRSFYNRFGSWEDAISAYNQGNPARHAKTQEYTNQPYVDKVLNLWKSN